MRTSLWLLLVGLAVACGTVPCDRNALAAPGCMLGRECIEDPIETTGGPVIGLELNGVSSYKGIPYAASPVGQLRWRAPQPPEEWIEPREMFEFGPACAQKVDPIIGEIVDLVDEDCLTLNVWTPARFQDERLPVMFWIHGGGFVTGGTRQPIFDGQTLAQENGVIVVTANYRLGILGFLAHPELSAEDPNNVSGNYGLKDQILALQWVKDNIASFGGDPKRITIFGQSAGGLSVTMLMASPLASGLFQRAIAQSGGASYKLRHLKESTLELVSMEERGVDTLNAALGSGATINQARALPWPLVVQADQVGLTMPGDSTLNLISIDDYVLLDTPYNTFLAGNEAPVPFITGSNKDEGTIYRRMIQINTVDELYYILAMTYGPAAAFELLELYEVTDDAEAQAKGELMLTDNFTAMARRTARAHASHGHRTFLYQFSRSTPDWDLENLGAYHGAEVYYVFGNLISDNGFGPVDEAVSANMRTYWTRFADIGRPLLIHSPPWSRFTVVGDRHLQIDAEMSWGSDLRKEYCDYWDALWEGAATD